MKTGKSIVFAFVGCFLTLPATAQDSGFLSDYSLLQVREGDEVVDRVYIKEGVPERLQDYNAIMVDQPEVFLAEDTKYKGAKPDALSQLASTMRFAMMERLEAGGFTVTEEPGPDVLYMRWAVTDLYLKKKKRGLLSYTPIGAVVHATNQAAVKDLWKKIDIIELTVELELLDSATGELFAAVVDSSGQRKTKTQEQESVTWEQLDANMRTIGERARCQIDNARLPEAERENCLAILIEPEYPEES